MSDENLNALVEAACRVLGNRDWQISVSDGESRSQLPAKTVNTATLANAVFSVKEGEKAQGNNWSPFQFKDGHRMAQNAIRADFMVLDVDLGYTAEEIAFGLEMRGWAGLIAPSPGYGKTSSTGIVSWRFDAFQDKCFREDNPRNTVQDFLQEDGWMLPWLAGTVTSHRTVVSTETVKTTKGEYVQREKSLLEVTHAPRPKLRVVLPLAKTWRVENYPSYEAAAEAWGNAYLATGEALGLRLDTSARDTGRLFYLAKMDAERIPAARASRAVIEGDPIDPFSLPAPKNVTPLRINGLVNPNAKQSSAAPGGLVIHEVDGIAYNFTEWVRENAHTFQVKDALKERGNALLDDRGERDGKLHIVCPFSDEHSSATPGGTFVANASDNRSDHGFVISCRHDSCLTAGRTRAAYIQKMIELDWLALEDLPNLKQAEMAKATPSDFTAVPADTTGWDHPIDILAGADNGLPDLPEHAVPSVIYRFAKDKAELMGVEIGMIALPALVIAAACITDEYRIQPKQFDTNWTESPRLWLGVVGDPASKKSPALKAPLSPLRAIEALHVQEDQHELSQYEFALKAYEAREKGYIQSLKKDPDAELSPLPNRPIKPKCRRKLVEDVTIEKLSDVLADNPGGILAFRDELAGWLASMDAYKQTGGADRTNWLELYNGGPRVIDRVGRGSWTVPNWSACVMGGIQPERLRELKGQVSSDGLIQRFLIVNNTRTNIPEQDREPDQQAAQAWKDLINDLSDLPCMIDQDVIRFSEGAQVHRRRVNEVIDAWQMLPNNSAPFKGALGKLKATYARLTLIMHAIENASTCAMFGQPLPAYVGGATAERAAALMLDYLLPHLAAFYRDVIGSSANEDHAEWIAGYLLAHSEKTKITVRDIRRAYGELRDADPNDIIRVMRSLDMADWVRAVSDDKGRGVKEWKVNPWVAVDFAERAAAERERREAAKARIKEAGKRIKRGEA